jgi:aspartyl protease family protein
MAMADQPENSTQQAGKTMMALAWVVALGLLITFFSRWEENAYNPNANPSSQQTADANSVILERNRQHHYVSAGSINTQAVTFLLDTGATDVVIPEGLAKPLGLLYGPRQQATTANGIIDVYQTQLEELTIGTITLYNVDASINPSMQGKAILLGMSALKNIEFTQRGGQLTLRQYR